MKNIFSFFGKNTKNEDLKVDKPHQYKEDSHSFVYGVEDIFELRDSNDLVVVGYVHGIMKPGMAVYVSNIGDDEGSIFLTEIVSMESFGKMVTTATNKPIGIRLKNGSTGNIKIGSVIHSRDASTKEVHDAYVFAIDATYIKSKSLSLTEDEFNKMSITDCAEAWNLYNEHIRSSIDGSAEKDLQIYRNKIDVLAKHLISKILDSEEIYTIINKKTGEPHLFSNTVKQNNGGYMCTPPDIMIVSKAYSKVYEQTYPRELFEIRAISNGENKDGIYNFLGNSFYLNGACGVAINSQKTAINANMIVPEPDYSNIPEIQIPISNPDLVRWLLLMGQIGAPQSEDAQLIYNLYYRFMSLAFPKAKFLVPMKNDGNLSPGDNGEIILEKDTKLSFPTSKGKNSKDCVPLFTDCKRLRMVYDLEWNAMIQPLSGFINTFDCSINPTEFTAAGCYITKETYDQMEEFASQQ